VSLTECESIICAPSLESWTHVTDTAGHPTPCRLSAGH